MLSDKVIEELERLAQNVMPEAPCPWSIAPADTVYISEGGGSMEPHPYQIMSEFGIDTGFELAAIEVAHVPASGEESLLRAEYIARVDPATVLELVREVRMARVRIGG